MRGLRIGQVAGSVRADPLIATAQVPSLAAVEFQRKACGIREG